jgi:hypothetical protein
MYSLHEITIHMTSSSCHVCSAEVVKALLYRASTIELSLSAATAAAAAAAAVLQCVNLYFTAAVRSIAERRYGSSSCERCPDEIDECTHRSCHCQCQRHVPLHVPNVAV